MRGQIFLCRSYVEHHDFALARSFDQAIAVIGDEFFRSLGNLPHCKLYLDQSLLGQRVYLHTEIYNGFVRETIINVLAALLGLNQIGHAQLV